MPIRRAAPDAQQIRQRLRARLLEQGSLVRSLLALRAQVGGSLFTRYGRCGKAGCACRRDRPHGPYHVLSGSAAGSGFIYLEARQLGPARELVRRARQFRRGLRRLRTLNRELVTLLRRYQRSTSAEGLARLGATDARR